MENEEYVNMIMAMIIKSFFLGPVLIIAGIILSVKFAKIFQQRGNVKNYRVKAGLIGFSPLIIAAVIITCSLMTIEHGNNLILSRQIQFGNPQKLEKAIETYEEAGGILKFDWRGRYKGACDPETADMIEKKIADNTYDLQNKKNQIRVRRLEDELNTALILAAELSGNSVYETSDKMELVQVLIKHGADVNYEIPCTHDADQVSEFHNYKEKSDYYANPINAKSCGRTALMYALINGNSELCQLLIDNGADLNHADATGYTVIHILADQLDYTSPEYDYIKEEIRKSADNQELKIDAMTQNNMHQSVYWLAYRNQKRYDKDKSAGLIESDRDDPRAYLDYTSKYAKEFLNQIGFSIPSDNELFSEEAKWGNRS